ncbi:MAG: HEPN domain-containing protein [Saprospiraceae bacterium]|nr:HEPN domain-containing protein [Saprospiraceae bacterium]
MRLQQAEECISDVEHCLATERLAMATNRIYYGMFYAMLALGTMRQFETSKHMQMIGWFNKNFVHTGIFPSHFGRMVKKTFEVRTGSDYNINEVPTADDLETLLADMKIFISTIKAWIEANPV